MFVNDKLKFDEWYETYNNLEYDIDNEVKKYCQNDVEILMLAVMKFRKLLMDITKIDPYTRNFTLASIGLEIYRAKFLEEKTLGITPIAEYRSRMQSISGNVYIDWIEWKIGIQLIREHRIGQYFVDAFSPTENCIYEYLGCYFHGCPVCIEEGRIENTNEMKAKYSAFYDRTRHLSRTYGIDYIYECVHKNKIDMRDKNNDGSYTNEDFWFLERRRDHYKILKEK